MFARVTFGTFLKVTIQYRRVLFHLARVLLLSLMLVVLDTLTCGSNSCSDFLRADTFDVKGISILCSGHYLRKTQGFISAQLIMGSDRGEMKGTLNYPFLTPPGSRPFLFQNIAQYCEIVFAGFLSFVKRANFPLPLFTLEFSPPPVPPGISLSYQKCCTRIRLKTELKGTQKIAN